MHPGKEECSHGGFRVVSRWCARDLARRAGVVAGARKPPLDGGSRGNRTAGTGERRAADDGHPVWVTHAPAQAAITGLVPRPPVVRSVRRAGLKPSVILAIQPVERVVTLTQTQLATAVADRAQLSKADAKRALAALDEVVLDELGNAEKVRIGGPVQLTVRVRRRRRRGGF